MSEDDLLRKLGQVAREEAGETRPPLDERWDRLTAGTLSAEEEAELRRLAASSEDARAAYEAFRPLDEAFHARIVAAIAAQASEAGTEARSRSQSEAQAAQPRGKLLPFRPAVRRLAAWGATATAAAATLAALLLRVPPLPVYAMELSGGSRITRGESAGVPELAPGDRFQAILRPDTAVPRAKSLRTRAFLLRGEEVRQVEVDSELDANGSVRVTGTLDPSLPAGSWTLWLVVGRRGALPDPADLRSLTAARAERQRNWVAMPATLNVRPREPG